MTVDWTKTLVRSGVSIRDALARIDSGGLRIALVVDAADHLLGTLTDGDVRRGMLRGVKLEAPADLVMNPKPRSATTFLTVPVATRTSSAELEQDERSVPTRRRNHTNVATQCGELRP